MNHLNYVFIQFKFTKEAFTLRNNIATKFKIAKVNCLSQQEKYLLS